MLVGVGGSGRSSMAKLAAIKSTKHILGTIILLPSKFNYSDMQTYAHKNRVGIDTAFQTDDLKDLIIFIKINH